MCRYFSNASILISHRIFITFSSVGRATSRKVIFHLFYIVCYMRFIACLLHVIFLHSSSFFHLAFEFLHFCWFFGVIHRFCIASLTWQVFCSFCCIVHLLFIVVLKCMNFCVFSMLFGYNVIGGCIFHVWGKFFINIAVFRSIFFMYLSVIRL